MDSDNDKYADKTLSELKDLLRARKLRVSGKKKDLVDRLVYHDRSSSACSEPAVEYHMTLPDATGYRDLHAGISVPPVTQQRMSDFFSCFDQKNGGKIEELYKERYLRYVRACCSGGATFISSAVWAEMKKAVSYKVDLQLDENGVVVEAQCECAVGQGPDAHCKHVACTLHGLVDFCLRKSILTEVTCTQVLQKFHKAKPHKGSPLKMRESYVIRGKSSSLLYDPRPLNRRNPLEIQEHARKLILNSQGSIKRPVMQLYAPADKRCVGIDHDYPKLTFEEDFLRKENISCISDEEIGSIEAATRTQSDRKWRAERCKRLTSSNFGTICKLTERRDVPQLLATLTTGDNIVSKATAHGRKYEAIAVGVFEKETGLKTMNCGLFVSRCKPFLAATPDRVIDCHTIVEIKCPYAGRDKEISEISVPYLYRKCDGKLHLKESHSYYYQVQGQLYCTQKAVCKFVVYTFKGIEVIEILYDKVFIASMLQALDAFYENHFRAAILDKFLYKKFSAFNFTT